MSNENTTLGQWLKSNPVFSETSSVINLLQTYQEWLNENLKRLIHIND